jgi:polyketide biosynthesis acyl carrier protein
LDRDTILATIIKQIRIVVPDLDGETIGPQDAMADLGVDSIDRQEIIILTLEALGLEIPMVQLHGPRNLGELADLLHAKLAA